MATSFSIRDAATQPVLAVRETCATPEIPMVLGRLFPEVIGWATRHGVRVVGPAFARYSDWQSDGGALEAGFVVEAAPETDGGRVRADRLGGVTTAYALHTGPYSQLGETYAALEHWIQEQGYEPAGTMWEEYLDPPTTPEAEQRTEIWWPVRKREASH
jgi:effector-binding domain-containing protein